jgi:hypothetical protein
MVRWQHRYWHEGAWDMTYKGHVENGVVVLDEEANLPEGAEVDIVLVQDQESPKG